MTTLTPEDRARLRDLAGKATPGPWRSARDRMEGHSVVESDHERIASTGSAPWSRCPVENAAYIAAANPATMTALLDALDEAEFVRAEAIVALAQHSCEPQAEQAAHIIRAEDERDQARAQVDRVRALLARMEGGGYSTVTTTGLRRALEG